MMPIKKPLVFEAKIDSLVKKGVAAIAYNNEILAAATLPDGKLHLDALRELARLQTAIISNYSRHPVDVLKPVLIKEKNREHLENILPEFKKIHPTGTVMDLRSFVINSEVSASDLPADMPQAEMSNMINGIKILIENILRVSVTEFTGPGIYKNLYNGDLRSILNSNLRSNGLMECIRSTNNPEGTETGGDHSWLPAGEIAMKEREKALLIAFESIRTGATTSSTAVTSETDPCPTFALNMP